MNSLKERRMIRARQIPLFVLPACIALLGCASDGGQIDAQVEYRVEVPEAVASSLDYPVLLTLSLGPKGREENLGGLSNQHAVVLCRSLEPFVYQKFVDLLANCGRSDFYARATLRGIQLNDPDACDDADMDGVLTLSYTEYQKNDQLIADDSMLAFDERDCGPQNANVDLKLQNLD